MTKWHARRKRLATSVCAGSPTERVRSGPKKTRLVLLGLDGMLQYGAEMGRTRARRHPLTWVLLFVGNFGEASGDFGSEKEPAQIHPITADLVCPALFGQPKSDWRSGSAQTYDCA